MKKRKRAAPRRRVAVRARRHRTLSVLPMDVQPGDRFTDEEGEWEVLTHPAAFRDGKALEATVRDCGPSRREKIVRWPAHEKVSVMR